MRKYFRWGFSGLTILILVVVGTLFRQNIEVWAEKEGYHNLLADGFRVLSEMGLGIWFAFGFVFLAGASLTLWIDYWIRRFSPKKAPAVEAGIVINWGEDRYERPKFAKVNSNVRGWHYSAGSDLKITLFFIEPIEDAVIEVATSKPDMKWKESFLCDIGVVIVITGGHADQKIYCNCIASSKRPDTRRQSVNVEYDTVFIDDEQFWQNLEEPLLSTKYY